MNDVAFYTKARACGVRRILKWYRSNIMRVLEHAKEKHTRDIDKTIRMANKLLEVLDENVAVAKPVPPHDVVPSENCDLMRLVDPVVVDIIMKSTTKGSTERYFKERYKLAPEEKFNYRAVTSWDYGWRQAESGVAARDAHRGRRRIVRDTFYRDNNVGRDPDHYGEPAASGAAACS